jgi:hypothetical protein
VPEKLAPEGPPKPTTTTTISDDNDDVPFQYLASGRFRLSLKPLLCTGYDALRPMLITLNVAVLRPDPRVLSGRSHTLRARLVLMQSIAEDRIV